MGCQCFDFGSEIDIFGASNRSAELEACEAKMTDLVRVLSFAHFYFTHSGEAR